MKELRLTVPGAPRTLKNHGEIIQVGARCPACKRGRPVMLPAKPWRAWLARVMPWLKPAAAGLAVCPLARPLNCAARFYRDRDQGDAVGFYQGLADLLQHTGVVKDDVWIKTWDGSRLLVDHARPRTEVTLTWSTP